MVHLKLKLDNKFVHLRIFDENNECLAEVKGKTKDHRATLAEIGRAYSHCFEELRTLTFFLESPKGFLETMRVGYEYTKDR